MFHKTLRFIAWATFMPLTYFVISYGSLWYNGLSQAQQANTLHIVFLGVFFGVILSIFTVENLQRYNFFYIIVVAFLMAMCVSFFGFCIQVFDVITSPPQSDSMSFGYIIFGLFFYLSYCIFFEIARKTICKPDDQSVAHTPTASS
jgi:hypothetical protein